MTNLDKDNRYVYFLYSDEQLAEKKKILAKNNKSFQPGIVVVNGKRQEYTFKSTKATMSRFFDVRVIAEGYEKDFVFEDPVIMDRKGN